jgi:hypothetical protein
MHIQSSQRLVESLKRILLLHDEHELSSLQEALQGRENMIERMEKLITVVEQLDENNSRLRNDNVQMSQVISTTKFNYCEKHERRREPIDN